MIMDRQEYYRVYRETHREQIKATHQRWWKKNRERYLKGWRKDSTDRTYNRQVLYSVWNNYTDEVVIIDGTVPECAKAMGISEKSFASVMTRTLQGKTKNGLLKKH